MRRKENIVESMEWKEDDIIKKQSRIDQDRYQAVVPEELTAKAEDLAIAANEVIKRCKYIAEDDSNKSAIEDFLQFVHWLTNEQTCSTTNGP